MPVLRLPLEQDDVGPLAGRKLPADLIDDILTTEEHLLPVDRASNDIGAGSEVAGGCRFSSHADSDRERSLAEHLLAIEPVGPPSDLEAIVAPRFACRDLHRETQGLFAS